MSADDPHLTFPGEFDPPMASLKEVPMHGRVGGVLAGSKWACSLPSDAVPDLTMQALAFDWRCCHCVALAQRVLRAGNDPLQVWRNMGISPVERVVRLSWLIARAVYWDGVAQSQES